MIRLLYDNLADTGALSSSSEDVDFPKENLLHPFRTKAARTTGITGEWHKWDLSAAKNINCVFLLNHNFDAGGTYKIQANATDVWTAPTVDEIIPFNPKNIAFFFTGGAFQFVRTLMTNSSGTYIEVGRTLFGTYYEPPRSFLKGWKDKKVDPGKISRSIGGQRHVDQKNRYRQISLNFDYIDDTEKYGELETMFDTVGKTKDLIISLDPVNKPNDLTFYGTFDDIPDFQHQILTKHKFGLKFSESL